MTRKKKKTGRVKLITIDKKNRQAAEQFRTIRSNINFALLNKELKTIVVSSPSSGDGKTMTAANLAIVFSQEGRKVLLVDGDMRKPTIHDMFRLSNNCGLSSYLVGKSDVDDLINSTYFGNLDVITSGITPPNPSELLGSSLMNELISEVKDRYDIVIFDTPPVLIVTDSTLIASKSDATLLIVRVKKNDVKDVEKAKEQLTFAGANLIGAVVNGKKQPKDSYYYV